MRTFKYRDKNNKFMDLNGSETKISSNIKECTSIVPNVCMVSFLINI
jgi:type IV secretory pathway component VirB8